MIVKTGHLFKIKLGNGRNDLKESSISICYDCFICMPWFLIHKGTFFKKSDCHPIFLAENLPLFPQLGFLFSKKTKLILKILKHVNIIDYSIVNVDFF